MATSGKFYTYDPCLRTGCPCGACYPYIKDPYAASWNCLSPCSKCPGGGCSPCPAPVRPYPEPCPAPPVLPPCPECPPCDKSGKSPENMSAPCNSVAIPICRPNRHIPCPVYECPPVSCPPKRCSYPGVPVCCGKFGPCMPIW